MSNCICSLVSIVITENLIRALTPKLSGLQTGYGPSGYAVFRRLVLQETAFNNAMLSSISLFLVYATRGGADTVQDGHHKRR